MIDSDVTVFPDPLSPTSPSTSPARIVKLTSSTTRDGSALGVELDGQPVDLEERRRRGVDEGSRAHARPW